MNTKTLPRMLMIVAVCLLGSSANAKLISGQDIIPAPAFIIDDAPGATNFHQQAFDERQNVILAADLTVDGGTIPAGTIVSSHMIFLNTPVGQGGASDLGVVWKFDGMVLGVMSDSTGSLEVASSPLLGAPGTVYPAAPFGARGMEGGDGYVVSGNQITVNMTVSEPGDWIRVITRVIEVEIDIKPGSFPNSINLGKNGVTPVAVLTTADFDATTVDPETVEFAGTAPLRWAYEDVDGDGDVDLILHFATPELNLDEDSTEATLTGNTYGGQAILGIDSVRIVPPK